MRPLVKYLEDSPEIQVGDVTIRKLKDGQIWIELQDGEGGTFPDDVFEEAIILFFKENF